MPNEPAETADTPAKWWLPKLDKDKSEAISRKIKQLIDARNIYVDQGHWLGYIPVQADIWGSGHVPVEEERKPMASGNANLGKPAPAQQEEGTPRCARHGKFMVYNPTEDRMECKVSSCTRIATRNRTFRNSVGAEPGESPAVYRGELQFVVDQTGEMYLYLPSANAMVSLAGLEQAEIFEDDPEAMQHQMRFINSVVQIMPKAHQEATLIKRRIAREVETDVIEQRMLKRQAARSSESKKYPYYDADGKGHDVPPMPERPKYIRDREEY